MPRTQSLRRRLVLVTLLICLLPLILLGGFASQRSQALLADSAAATLSSQTGLKGGKIEAYFLAVRNDVVGLSQSFMTQHALRRFDEGFSSFLAQQANGVEAGDEDGDPAGDDAEAQAEDDALVEPDTSAARAAVAAFVDDVFGARFRELAGAAGPDGAGFADSLSPTAALLQDLLIASNPAPLGEKDSLIALPGDTDYGEAHAQLHPIYRAHLQRNEYYDIFLVNTRGDLVYSVFKELDYATNLADGAWRDSGLSRTWRAALALSDGQSVAVDDYAPYEPSYRSPAMFLGSPVIEDGQTLGVLIVQISLARISAIVADPTGLQEGQDVYVAGPDRLLRSDSRLGREEYTVARHFAQPEASRLSKPALEAALAGQDYNGVGESIDGAKALVSGRPLAVMPGLDWAIVATYDHATAFAPARQLTWTVAVALLVVGLLAAFASWRVAGRIVRPISAAQVAAKRIAELQLDNRLVAEGNDEVAQLTRALDTMQQDLRKRIERESRIAAENAAVRQGLESSSSGLMIRDSQGRVRYANGALLGMLRRIESRIAERLPGFSADTLQDSAFDPLALCDSVVASEAGGGRIGQLGVDQRVLELSASEIRDADGQPAGEVIEWQDRSAENAFREGLRHAAQQAAAGFLDARVEVNADDPRFAELARMFNELVGNTAAAIGEVETVISALAEGNLSARSSAELLGKFGELNANTNRTAEALAGVIGEIQQVVREINAASAEIAQGNGDLSRRTEQAAASIEETAAALHQVNSMVGSAAQNAGEAKTLAGRAADSAAEGGDVVRQVVTTMEGIRGASKQMSEIIAVIDGIAFQTNILALNAAVEAARAGEQGRGFAVVASEVRALAQRSADAAKQIAGLIRDSESRVQGGASLAHQAGERMDTIVASAQQVAEIVADIAAGAVEQAKGISEVNAAVEQLDEATQANAALVEQMAASAEALSQQAGHLDAIAARFVLDGAVSSGKDIANFADMISAHQSWKFKLRDVLQGRNNETLDPAKVSQDHRCAMGKWIYGPGQRHAGSERYETLKDQHARFHRCAGKILALNADGQHDDAADLLGRRFAQLSESTISAIREMARHA